MNDQTTHFHIFSVIIATLFYFISLTHAASLTDSASETLSARSDRSSESAVSEEFDLESEDEKEYKVEVDDVSEAILEVNAKIEEAKKLRRERVRFQLYFGGMKRRADRFLAEGEKESAYAAYHAIIHNERCPEYIVREIVKILNGISGVGFSGRGFSI